ncbi:MAG TPA: hypothetical protein VFF52_26480 [Isosphaeraceae bacterium]|nr:hypothetical protein [Isosphaeraceae bacterium]
MNTAQALKAAPLLSLVAFLAYSAYSMHASLPGADAQDAALAKGLDILVQDLLDSGTVAAAKLGQEVRDPFQAVVTQPAAVDRAKPQETPAPAPAADPLAEIVQGLSLEATFIQGRDQIAIIDGRIYSRGQRLMVEGKDGASAAPLSLASVFATQVVLQGGGRTYVLGYPDQLGKRKDESPAGPPLSREATLAELDPGGQMAMFQKLLNSPLGVLGKSLVGKSLSTDPSPGAAAGPQSSRSRGGLTISGTGPGNP